MTERTALILETAVRDFIEQGRPITSENLYEEYDFGIKPAMIRLELGDLTDLGYFYKTHPSGGRFPTDKAYHFFIDSIKEETEDEFLKASAVLAKEFAFGHYVPFIQGISGYLNALSIGYDPLEGEIYESGLTELLYNVDIHKKEEIVEIIKDYETFLRKLLKTGETAFKGFYNEKEEYPSVFVGENPFTTSECVSVIVDSFPYHNSRFSLLVIGPKRMDYEKSLGFFKMLRSVNKK